MRRGMNNLTIRWRIIASFAVVLALMVVMAAVAYLRLLDVEHQAAFIAQNAYNVARVTPRACTVSTAVR